MGRLVETLQPFAPRRPVRSLRQGTSAARLRAARTCDDRPAGRLGVHLMATLVEHGHVVGCGGTRGSQEPLAGFGHEVDYRLSSSGQASLVELGVVAPSRCRLLRSCVDWTEQRHHLGGALGRGLLDRFRELDRVRQARVQRAVDVTPAGEEGLCRAFGWASLPG